MRFGSLFAGIGGFDLGLERAGHACAWQCEIDPHARAILNKHWPEVPCYGDIRSINWADVEPVDLICGGYPCQPFSHAGARAGKSDPRHLWPEVARCLRHLRPRFVLLENVAAHLSLGFGHVLGDLAALGYDAWWDCIPAAALGAPHLRDRVFVVAWRSAAHAYDAGQPACAQHDEAPGVSGAVEAAAHANGCDGERRAIGSRRNHDHGQDARRAQGFNRPRDAGASGAAAHARRAGCEKRHAPAESRQVGFSAGVPDPQWALGPPVPPVRGVDDGLSHRMDVPRLRGLGNAIVPQIAELLGGVLAELERA